MVTGDTSSVVDNYRKGYLSFLFLSSFQFFLWFFSMDRAQLYSLSFRKFDYFCKLPKTQQGIRFKNGWVS